MSNSAYKAIAECTVDDLTFCISERRDQIGALQGQIDKFQTIVNAMIAANVETAGDLPEGFWDGRFRWFDPRRHTRFGFGGTVTAVLQPTDFPDAQPDSQLRPGGFGSDSKDGAAAQAAGDSQQPCGLGPILADPQRTLAHLVDAALNRMAPMAKPRQVGADYLTGLEQRIDVWGPDELWYAHTVHEYKTANLPTKTPVGADVPALPPGRPVAGADGPTSSSIELELKVTIQDVLRRCETPWPTTTAGIVAREILHHYTVTPK